MHEFPTNANIQNLSYVSHEAENLQKCTLQELQ